MSKITEALRIAEFPPEAADYFENIYQEIETNPTAFEHLRLAEYHYYHGGDYATELTNLAKATGLHQYTVEMLLLLFCMERLKGSYKKRGYSEELLKDSMADLRYKLEECKAVHGIWGTFVFWWFKRFYECKTFKLGRLEFEWEELEFDYNETLRKGNKVVNCHIPSAGPLYPESVEQALASAYEFFGFSEKGERMPVVCESWMLYPPHYELFPESGNLRQFFERFDVYHAWEDAKNEDAWRIFNRADHNYESFPQDTRLREHFYHYLNDGKTMGSGYGILFFGPEDAQIARIKHMEMLLDSISTVVRSLEQTLEGDPSSEKMEAARELLSGVESDLQQLTHYYEGPLWRKDFEADEAGLIPKGLKRGVLSEDAVYNVLADVGRVRGQIG